MLAPALAALVASFIAGHPTQLACDADTNPSPTPPPPGFVVESWTRVGGSVSHFIPARCADMAAKPGTEAFARGVRVLIHEAAIARGVRTEDCASAWETLAVFDVLQRFCRIPMFTSLSWKIGAQVLAETRLRPANFQPTGQSCAGQP